MSKDIDPPAHLSEQSLALWRELVPNEVRSSGRRILLLQALQALDRSTAAHALVEQQGLLSTTKKSGMQHPNPAIGIERAARQEFVKIWLALGLGHDPFSIDEMLAPFR